MVTKTGSINKYCNLTGGGGTSASQLTKKTGMAKELTKDDYVGAHALVLGIIRYYASTLRSICRSNTQHHDVCSRMAADALAFYEYGEVNSIACYRNHSDKNTDYGLSLIKDSMSPKVMIFGSNGETLAEYDSLHHPFLTDEFWTIVETARTKIIELVKEGRWNHWWFWLFEYPDREDNPYVNWQQMFDDYYDANNPVPYNYPTYP